MFLLITESEVAVGGCGREGDVVIQDVVGGVSWLITYLAYDIYITCKSVDSVCMRECGELDTLLKQLFNEYSYVAIVLTFAHWVLPSPHTTSLTHSDLISHQFKIPVAGVVDLRTHTSSLGVSYDYAIS